MVESKNLNLKVSITRGEYTEAEADRMQSDTRHKNVFCDNVIVVPITNTGDNGISAALIGYDGVPEPLDNPHHPEASDLDTVITAWAAMTHMLSRDERLSYGIRQVLARSCSLVGEIHSDDEESEEIYREH